MAGLLGNHATLNTEHHIDDEGELGANYSCGCGCFIQITDSTGDAWEFQRGDSSWNLWRSTDIDESGSLRNWTELRVSRVHAHPGHLASLIKQEIAAAVAASPRTVASTPSCS